MPTPHPTIALTLGDVAGIGPEVAVRACADPRIIAACRPVIVGHPEVVRRAITHCGLKIVLAEVTQPEELPPLNTLACWNPPTAPQNVIEVPPGHNDARAGRAAYEYLVAAANAALTKRVAAITTHRSAKPRCISPG